MTTLANPALEAREQRVVIHHVSWTTYERLMADTADASSPRFTYEQGVLEIMSPSSQHEELADLLATITELVAEEQEVEFLNLGSTTFRRPDLEQGLEPDSCFYVQHVDCIHRKREVDLLTDPPPDLVIEVKLTNPAVSKLSIYARLGVPEIWLADGQRVQILRLSGDRYEAGSPSRVLPLLTESVLSEFLEQRNSLSMLAWRRTVRSWAREQKPQRFE